MIKTLIAGANLPLSSEQITLKFAYRLTVGELDISAYLLSEKTGKVRGDADMLFFGQRYTQDGEIVLDLGADNSTLRLDIANIDPEIKKIAVCATIDGSENLSVMEDLHFSLHDGELEVAEAKEEKKPRTEAALILAEIYKHHGAWKCRWVMQGFQGGLRALAEHFGVEIADEEDATDSPSAKDLTAPESTASPISENTENNHHEDVSNMPFSPPKNEKNDEKRDTPPAHTDEMNPLSAPESREDNSHEDTETTQSSPQSRNTEQSSSEKNSSNSDQLDHSPPLILSREESNFRLYRHEQGFGRISINLKWALDPNHKAGFLSNLLGMGTIDLDLGAMVRLKDGSSHVVQALGNQCGSRYSPPFIELQGDDRTGERPDGEWLFLSGEHWQEIDLVVVFCFIYRGKVWPQAEITLDMPHHGKILIPLGEYDPNLGLCGVVELRNQSNDINIQRIMKFFLDHKKLDQHYGFGIEWEKRHK